MRDKNEAKIIERVDGLVWQSVPKKRTKFTGGKYFSRKRHKPKRPTTKVKQAKHATRKKV